MKNSVSQSKPTTIAWLVWIVASIFYAYQYILRVMPNIMLDDIMRQFDIGAAAFGQFSGIYYIGYSLMHLPIGIMLDRYGPKRVVSGCILVSVLGMLPLLFSTHWIYPIVGRLFIGMGSSAAILGVFKIIRMTFSEQRFARFLSLSVMIGLIGAIYGGGPVSYMRDALGYQAVLYIIAAAGVLLALFTFLIVPDTRSVPESTVLADIREVLSNQKVLWSCIFAGLMVGPLEGFADVWGTAFLKQVYGFDGVVAASFPSLIFIGMCFGGPVLSFIAEKVGDYFSTIIGAGLVMAFCFILFLNVELSSFLLSTSFVIVGISSAYQILAIYKASTYVREQVAGLTTAMANMIIMIFGYAFHTIMGASINMLGGSHNTQALITGISVIPVALLIGSIGFIVLFVMDKRAHQRSVRVR